MMVDFRNNKGSHFLASKHHRDKLREPTYNEIKSVTMFIANFINDLNRVFMIDEIYIGEVSNSTFTEIEKTIYIDFVKDCSSLIAITNFSGSDKKV